MVQVCFKEKVLKTSGNLTAIQTVWTVHLEQVSFIGSVSKPWENPNSIVDGANGLQGPGKRCSLCRSSLNFVLTRNSTKWVRKERRKSLMISCSIFGNHSETDIIPLQWRTRRNRLNVRLPRTPLFDIWKRFRR
jgi:hypothetical protein